MTNITAGNDVYFADRTDAKGKQLIIGRENSQDLDEDGGEVRYDREILRVLSRLEEGFKHVESTMGKMDTRIFTLESEVKKVSTSRWSWFDVLFVAGLSSLVSIAVNFLDRLI